MEARLSHKFSRLLHVGTFLGFLLLLSACTHRSTTTFFKMAWPQIDEKMDAPFLSNIEPSCLNLDKIKKLINNDPAFVPLKTYCGHDLINQIEEALKRNHIDQCKKIEYKYKLDSSKNDNESIFFSNFKKRLREDNRGLFLESDEEECGFLSSSKCKSKVSISPSRMASLALSTRPLPSEQEPGNVVEQFKERAQAALIEYAKEFAKCGKSCKENADPGTAVEDLLKKLSPTKVPAISETQKFELTLSSALNSASVDDRFDYIAAYVTVPPLPHSVNGSISLERLFLQKLQSLNFVRPISLRQSLLPSDIQTAIDLIKVRIEIVDNIITIPQSLELGSLKSTASLTGNIGLQNPTVGIQVADIGGTLSTERLDKIMKELDKRSFWISNDRTLLRITQRGMGEATISGSITSSLTLKIPKTSLYVLEVAKAEPTCQEKDCNTKCDKIAKAEKIKECEKEKCGQECPPFGIKISLSDIEQPVYLSIDAMGMALGVVRVAVPGLYCFQKEPDGRAYAVAEKPMPLHLSSYKRILLSLVLQDIIDLIKEFGNSQNVNKIADNLEERDTFRSLGVYSTMPEVRQRALMKDYNTFHNFVEAVRCGRMYLKKVKVRDENKENKDIWYKIVETRNEEEKAQRDGATHATYKKENEQQKPDAKEIWIGIEDDDGIIQPFKEIETAGQTYNDFIKNLPDEIKGSTKKCNSAAFSALSKTKEK
jgi:hypothetical protein